MASILNGAGYAPSQHVAPTKEKPMAMKQVYPFDMDWSHYSNYDLVRAAREQLNHLDREDMCGLIAELTNRWVEDINLDEKYLETRRIRKASV